MYMEPGERDATAQRCWNISPSLQPWVCRLDVEWGLTDQQHSRCAAHTALRISRGPHALRQRHQYNAAALGGEHSLADKGELGVVLCCEGHEGGEPRVDHGGCTEPGQQLASSYLHISG